MLLGGAYRFFCIYRDVFWSNNQYVAGNLTIFAVEVKQRQCIKDASIHGESVFLVEYEGNGI